MQSLERQAAALIPELLNQVTAMNKKLNAIFKVIAEPKKKEGKK